MKVTIGVGDCGASAKYRLWVPYIALSKACGFELFVVDSITIKHGHVTTDGLRMADVAVFQRVGAGDAAEWTVAAMRYLVAAGKRVVLELDDNLIHSIPKYNPASQTYGTGKHDTKLLLQAMELAERVIVSSPNLADVVRKYNENVHVAQNALANEDFARYKRPITVGRKRNNEFRIGFAGSLSHYGDLAMIAKPVSDFVRAHADVKLVIFGGEDLLKAFPYDVRMKIEHVAAIDATQGQMAKSATYRDAIMPRYYAQLGKLDLDVAIAPLEPNSFNAARSKLKALEYGMAAFPVLASRFGPFREYMAESDCAIATSASDAEWTKMLRILYADPEMRAELALRNQEHVARHYLISSRLQEWKAALGVGELSAV